MNRILFENIHFRSEKTNDGTYIVTILKDDRNFFGINMEGCKLITTAEGFVDYELTESVKMAVDTQCSTFKEKELLIHELRNRTLNVLMMYL